MKIQGIIVSGGNKASKTLLQQTTFFKNYPIPLDYLDHGSLNVDISPNKWEIIDPDISIKGIEWRANFVEDFNFVTLKVRFNKIDYPGLIYNPTRTKNPKTVVEVISKLIPGIKNGDTVSLTIPDKKIKLY